jgi:hypothetical protein
VITSFLKLTILAGDKYVNRTGIQRVLFVRGKYGKEIYNMKIQNYFSIYLPQFRGFLNVF